MAQATYEADLAVKSEQFVRVVTDYEKYPQFVEGCKGVQVSRTGSKIKVDYQVEVMSKKFSYSLDHHEDIDAGIISWTLVSSDLFKKNNGRWEIKSLGEKKSKIIYTLDVEFKIAIPKFILGNLVKGSLPAMVSAFEKQTIKNFGSK